MIERSIGALDSHGRKPKSREGLFGFRYNQGYGVEKLRGKSRMPMRCESSLAKARVESSPQNTPQYGL
jgi:hypothetical protein